MVGKQNQEDEPAGAGGNNEEPRNNGQLPHILLLWTHALENNPSPIRMACSPHRRNKGHSVLQKGQPRREDAPKHKSCCQESREAVLS